MALAHRGIMWKRAGTNAVSYICLARPMCTAAAPLPGSSSLAPRSNPCSTFMHFTNFPWSASRRDCTATRTREKSVERRKKRGQTLVTGKSYAPPTVVADETRAREMGRGTDSRQSHTRFNVFGGDFLRASSGPTPGHGRCTKMRSNRGQRDGPASVLQSVARGAEIELREIVSGPATQHLRGQGLVRFRE